MGSVLVVEDDPAVLSLVCDALAGAGHSVECVGTFAEGYGHLSSRSFDLVLANARLPDGSVELTPSNRTLGGLRTGVDVLPR
jgi:DNA-binding response OmpR family regulator